MDDDVAPPAPESALDNFGPAFEDSPTKGSKKASQPMTSTAALADRFRHAEPDAPQDIAGTALIQIEAITTYEQAPTLAQQLEAFQVSDAGTYEQAAELLKVGASGLKVIEGFFDENIARAHATHKGLTQQKAKYYGPLETAVRALKARAVGWAQEQERKREAEQRRLDELAAAERRRQEQAAEAERVRLEAEAKALLEQGNAAAASETLLKAAEVVDEVRNAPPPVAPPVAAVVPKSKGVSVKANWTYRITDKAAFIRAVVDGTIPLDAVVENATYLRGKAKVDKNTLRWPGVSFYDEGSMSVRG